MSEKRFQRNPDDAKKLIRALDRLAAAGLLDYDKQKNGRDSVMEIVEAVIRPHDTHIEGALMPIELLDHKVHNEEPWVTIHQALGHEVAVEAAQLQIVGYKLATMFGAKNAAQMFFTVGKILDSDEFQNAERQPAELMDLLSADIPDDLSTLSDEGETNGQDSSE